MNNFHDYIELFEIYKSLLTKKQQEIFYFYFFEDLTLKEISEILKISKSAVSVTIKKIKVKLEDWELKLKFKGEKNV